MFFLSLAIKRSLITPAELEVAPSARRKHASAGWRHENENFCLPTTSMSCQRAPRAECAGPGQPTSVLRSVVHRQRSDLARGSSRSQTLGRRDWRAQHFAHLGTKPFAASPYSLRHSRGRPISRPVSLDPPSLSFLPTREGPQPRLPREIPSRSETSLPRQETTLCGPIGCAGRSPAVRSTDSPPTPPGLGRLYQTGLWRSDAGVALSGPLHPSGGHFQSSIIGL